MLEDTIAMNQSAFLRGRQILDGILIANEIAEEYRVNGKEGLVFKMRL